MKGCFGKGSAGYELGCAKDLLDKRLIGQRICWIRDLAGHRICWIQVCLSKGSGG